MLLKTRKRASTALLFVLAALATVALVALIVSSCINADRTELALGPQPLQAAVAADDIGEGVKFEPRALGIVPGKTTSELRFTWYGGKGVKTGWIRLFKGDGSLVSVTKATSGVVPRKSNNCDNFDCANDSMSYHKVAVTGLSLATEYQYSVSNDSVNWSYRKYFKTTAGGDKFTFVALGDAQVTRGDMQDMSGYCSSWFPCYASADGSTAACWRETMEKVVTLKPDFILGLGDQVDAMAGDEKEYDIFFAPPGMQSIPYAPVVGNHDVHAQFIYHYNPPYASSSMSSISVYSAGVMNYYYLYNNILFVALHTGFYAQSVDGSSAAKPHVTAMGETLTRAKAEFSGKYDWLIVQHHKSTHSQSAQSTTDEIGYWVKAGFNKLMEDHKVDLVFSGHDHSYARSHVVTKADVDKAGTINTAATSGEKGENITLDSGTVFFCLTTTSGVKYYPLYFEYNVNTQYPYLKDGSIGTAKYSKDNPTWSSYKAEQNYYPQYTLCEVDGTTMRVRTFNIDDDAKPVDEVTITKTSTPKTPTSILSTLRLVSQRP